MDFITHLKEAVSNLFSAKLRSFLAILGILVGTGSVVALVMSTQAATEHALLQFKSLGTNIIAASLQSVQMDSSKTQQEHFHEAQVPQLWQANKALTGISPYISLYQSLYVNGISASSQILGVSGGFQNVLKLKLKRGRFISVLDKSQPYCLLGATLAKRLRDKGVNPMGQEVVVGKMVFTVIGVLANWKPSLFLYADINNGIIVPLKSAYYLSKDAKIQNIIFRIKEGTNVEQVQSSLKSQFHKVTPTLKVYFRNPENIIKAVSKSRSTLDTQLVSIAAISLVVGGIGVMNIMLVSVVERRREIGIRMALGAKRRDIKMMFLIESILLTVFGGVVGILIGVAVSISIAELRNWGFHFYWSPPLLGFGVSLLVGIVSGYYPALRASKLDPIQTLQSD